MKQVKKPVWYGIWNGLGGLCCNNQGGDRWCVNNRYRRLRHLGYGSPGVIAEGIGVHVSEKKAPAGIDTPANSPWTDSRTYRLGKCNRAKNSKNG